MITKHLLVAITNRNRDIAELLVRKLKSNSEEASQRESVLSEAAGRTNDNPETCLSGVTISDQSTKIRSPGSS